MTAARSPFEGNKALKNVLLSFAAKLAIVALNAGTGILTARLLHPAGRGELAALLLWPQVLSGAVTLGLPSALTFSMRSKPESAAQFKLAALVMSVCLGALAALVAICFAPELMRQYRPEVVFIAQWLMPNTIIGVVLLVGRGALEARGDFRTSNLVLILPPSLSLLGLSMLGLLHRLTPEWAAVVYICSGLPAFALLLRSLQLKLGMRLVAHTAAARELLSYGIRSYGTDLCGTLALYVDQALVVTLLSPAQMGIYVVALSVSRMLNVLPQSIAMVLFPKMVGLGKEFVLAETSRALRLAVAFMSVGAATLLVFGPRLVGFFYGPAYGELTGVLNLLAAEALLRGCVTICAQAFMASDRPGTVTAQQIAGLLAAVPLLVVLIPRLGVQGAALGLLLSTGIRFAMVLISFPTVLKSPAPQFLLSRSDFEYAGSFLRRFQRSAAV